MQYIICTILSSKRNENNEVFSQIPFKKFHLEKLEKGSERKFESDQGCGRIFSCLTRYQKLYVARYLKSGINLHDEAFAFEV